MFSRFFAGITVLVGFFLVFTPAIAQRYNPCKGRTWVERNADRGNTPGMGCHFNDGSAAEAAAQRVRDGIAIKKNKN
jgi:hypothetical protein